MGRLVDLEFEVDGAARRAALYLPAAYETSSHDWPLVVFLHGLGERGDDNVAQTRVGIYSAIEDHPERFPCLVLMPQCPGDRVWKSLPADWARDLPSASDHVDAALATVLENHRVDRSRIALTGISMGGFGALLHGATTIDRWCAIVAVCGGGRTEDAPSLAKKPLWLIHGGADPIVPDRLSRELFAAVKEAGGTVELSIYEGVGHDSWNRAYRDRNVIEFLLARR